MLNLGLVNPTIIRNNDSMVDKLPFRIRFERKKAYGVSVVSKFTHPECIGECDPNTKQIKIRSDLSDFQAISTLTHEIIHLINFERDLELTENQVLGLEAGLFKVFELNQDFLKLFYKTLLKRKLGA